MVFRIGDSPQGKRLLMKFPKKLFPLAVSRMRSAMANADEIRLRIGRHWFMNRARAAAPRRGAALAIRALGHLPRIESRDVAGGSHGSREGEGSAHVEIRSREEIPGGLSIRVTITININSCLGVRKAAWSKKTARDAILLGWIVRWCGLSAIGDLDADCPWGGVLVFGNPAFSQSIGIPGPPIAAFRIASGHFEALEVALDGRQGIFPGCKSFTDLGWRG
jgi:hypothetical protein